MDKLQWFKFSPSSWMMGRIQRCNYDLQGRFINLCCTYWNHKCTLEIEEAEIELGEDGFREAMRLRIITTDGDYLSIDFLDEQYMKTADLTEERSKQGALGNLKRWHKDVYVKYMKGEISIQEAISIAKGSPPDRPPIAKGSQTIAEKTREEERREEKEEGTAKAFVRWFNKSIKELKGSGNFKLTDKVKRQYNARVKDGYEPVDFQKAFSSASKNQFHTENNYQYLTPEFFTRADILEKWCNVEEKPTNNAHLFMS